MWYMTKLLRDEARNTTSVPVCPVAATAPRRLAYTITTRMVAGSRVQLCGQIAVTNPNKVPVGVGWYLEAVDYEDGTGSILNRRRLNDPTMENITPDMHHARIGFAIWDHTPAGMVTYQALLYAVSTAPNLKSVIVENNGEMDAAIFSPVGV